GWGEQTEKAFQLELPSDVSDIDRVLLEYRMGAWGERPGEWDNTTMLFIEDKSTGERYEIARAISPYGNAFDSDWSKTFWIDVTEFLPMLTGTTTFHLYYGGWDATDTRAHTTTFTFNYYKGEPQRNVIFTHELYDSSRDGNSGYRGWAYGVEGHDIEDISRLGERTVEIPEEVKSLEMRVAITGHGHDQGKFIERENYLYDYRLGSPESAAIGWGATAYASDSTACDMYGASRLERIDVGAYQYTQTSPFYEEQNEEEQ
ncbi:MAG: hypothetical protein J6U43_01330, partial [Bacteroidales bacterium]|nr:hypothetical protein [Bacteroidales bacterium]